MIRRTSIFLILTMLISFFAGTTFPIDASAATEEKQYGSLTYTVSDGEIKIVKCDNDAEGSIEIPNTIEEIPVTSIGDAFNYCKKITTITIPENCVDLSSLYLYECSSLEQVVVAPNNPAYCSVEGVLYSKDKTELLIMPQKSAGSIFEVPDSVISIRDHAFHNSALERITMTGVNTIGIEAFDQCLNLKSVECGNNLKKIELWAFRGCKKLETVNFSTGFETIGDQAFQNCGSLETIDLPIGLKRIGQWAFRNCTKLTSVSIKENCTSLSWDAFDSCFSLERITVEPENPQYCSDQGVLYNKNKTSLIKAPSKGIVGSFTVPDSVHSIYTEAFMNSLSLKEIKLPDNLERIWARAFKGCTELTSVFIPKNCTQINENPFEYCSSLDRIAVDPENPQYCSKRGILFSKDMTELISAPYKRTGASFVVPSSVTTIARHAFIGNSLLEKITLNDVAVIEMEAFAECKKLKSVLSEQLSEIKDDAFDNCENLKEIVLPASLKKMSADAFHLSETAMTNSIDVYFRGNMPAFNSNIVVWRLMTVYYPEGNETWSEDKLTTHGTVTWKTWNPDNYEPEPEMLEEIHQFSYSFSNSNSAFGYPSDYTIPLSSYQLIYGENVRAETVYLNKTYYNIATGSKRYWNGNCAGMTATSELLTDSTNGINPVNFNESAVKPKDLKAKDTNTELEIDLTTFIEAMHVAQYTQIFKNDRMSTVVVTQDINRGKNNLNEFHDVIKSETENGRPVLLAMIPGNGMGGHAILGYGVVDYSDGTSEILTYDNRRPMEEIPLTLTKDEKGNYITWSYDMDVYGIWGTNVETSSISFVYYNTLMEIWKSRGNLGESNSTNLISVNSDAFSLYSSNGEELARVENGEMVKNSDGIELMEKELSLRVEDRPENMIIAPVASYRVVNHDDSLERLELVVANEDLGASVKTTADEVVVAVQDSINSNIVTVCATPEDTYEVSLKSTMDDDYNEIIATGKGTEEDASISMVDGVLDAKDCELASLVVDGKNHGPYTISASAKTGGKISPNGDVRKLKGENQKYEIMPDAGYMISDVLVDGKSIGAVSEHEFKNIAKEHSIVAVFEKTVLYGDANGDDKVDASDLTRLARHLAKIESIKDIALFGNSDVNHDGKVDSDDLTKLARFIARIIASLD